MDNNNLSIDGGTTSIALDLTLLEAATGLTLSEANPTSEAFSEDFQLGFAIAESTDFTFTDRPFTPTGGSIEHTGTVTLATDESQVTIGDFSIGFDATRVTESTSGFFVADTTDDALGLEVVFDVSEPGQISVDGESLTIARADLLVAPEFAAALGDPSLARVDLGDTRIDANIEMKTTSELTPAPNAIADLGDVAIDADVATRSDVVIESEIDPELTVLPELTDLEVALGVAVLPSVTAEPEAITDNSAQGFGNVDSNIFEFDVSEFEIVTDNGFTSYDFAAISNYFETVANSFEQLSSQLQTATNPVTGTTSMMGLGNYESFDFTFENVSLETMGSFGQTQLAENTNFNFTDTSFTAMIGGEFSEFGTFTAEA